MKYCDICGVYEEEIYPAFACDGTKLFLCWDCIEIIIALGGLLYPDFVSVTV